MKEGQLSFGQYKFDAGWTITAKPVENFTHFSRKSTEFHEATHAVAAVLNNTEVIEVTNVAGPGYYGMTRLGRADAIAAVAAHAMGCNGTGHDLMIVHHMGHEASSASYAARSLLSGREKEIYSVATLLAQRRSISGEEVKYAMQKAVNPDAHIFASGPKGERVEFIANDLEF